MNAVKDRLMEFIKYIGIPIAGFERRISVSGGYVKNISRSIQPNILENISHEFPELNIEWLLVNRGSMIKRINIEGDNKGIVQSGDNSSANGNFGTVSGDYVSVSSDAKVKKIIRDNEIEIEMEQSIENLQQTNKILQTRINDLEALVESKNEIIDFLKEKYDIPKKM